MKPTFVTFTGIDERTDIDRVVSLSKRYIRRVEWGVLISKKNTGHANRYPSMGFVKGAMDGLSIIVSLSLHVCGVFSRQIIEQGVVDMDLVGEIATINSLASPWVCADATSTSAKPC